MIRSSWRDAILAVMLAAAALSAAGPSFSQEQAAQADEAIHNDLRALRDRVVTAVNDRKPDLLLPKLTDDVAFTAMNNEVVHGKQDAKAYYERMLGGAASLLQDMHVTAEPDALATLYDSGRTAVSTGSSTASFKLRGGLAFTAPLRWTASLVDEGGTWKIAAIHFSANVFDNPVDAGIRKYLWIPLIAVGAIALLLGFLLGRRRRRA